MNRLPTWAMVGSTRLEHIRRVAALMDEWASTLALSVAERERWLRAAWLHDALRDAPRGELIRWVDLPHLPVALLHGPAAAARAETDGEHDAGILAAIRYHSVGWAGWDMVGWALYAADYLEPGRDPGDARRAALAAGFPAEPVKVVRKVAKRRMKQIVRTGSAIPEETWAFWNSLVKDPLR
jgi:HD superfamily phosphohydrolase YqeK